MSSRHERRLEQLYERGDAENLFRGDTAMVPWPRHPRRPEPDALDAVRRLLRDPVHLFDVDPRLLVATQPKLVRHHFYHYERSSGMAYEWFGRTSADPDSELNRFPVLQPDGNGRFIIRSGHHRAAVALIKGSALRCRVVGRQPSGDAIAVTPRLMVGASADVPVISPDDLHWVRTEMGVEPAAFAAEKIRRRGETVVASSPELAQLVLFHLRCGSEWAATLLRRSFPDAEIQPLDEEVAPPRAKVSRYQGLRAHYCEVCGALATAMGPAGWVCGAHRDAHRRARRYDSGTGAPL